MINLSVKITRKIEWESYNNLLWYIYYTTLIAPSSVVIKIAKKKQDDCLAAVDAESKPTFELSNLRRESIRVTKG